MMFGRALERFDFDDSARRKILEEVRALMESDYGGLFPLRVGGSATAEAIRRRRLAGRWVYVVPFLPAVLMMAMLAAYLFLDSRGWWGWSLLAPMLLIQVMATGIVMSWVWRRTTTPYLAAVLAKRGITICERCRHVIAVEDGSPTVDPSPSRCPECGTSVALKEST